MAPPRSNESQLTPCFFTRKDRLRPRLFASKLSVEGKLLDPVETSPDEQEFVVVSQLKLDVNLVIVHPTIEDELIPVRALKGEVRLPVLVAPLGEGESFVCEIDGGGIMSERIVHPPKVH